MNREVIVESHRDAVLLEQAFTYILYKWKKWIFVSGVAGMLLGALVFRLTDPKFVATTTLLLDSQKLEWMPGSSGEMSLDTTAIDSQVELIKSDAVMRRVVEGLDLDQRFEPKPSPLSNLSTAVRGVIARLSPRSDPQNEEPLTSKERVLEYLADNVIVRRVGLTRVIFISVRATEPRLAADIANETAQAYLDEQLSSMMEPVQRAESWITNRMTQLKEAITQQEATLAKLREEPKGDPNTGTRIAESETLARRYRGQLEELLRRSKMVNEQMVVPYAPARIISEASVPRHPAEPRLIIHLVGGIVSGSMVGTFLLILRARRRLLAADRVRTL